MPRTARLKGSSRERVETAFSAGPLTPTNVPLRVYRFCDADNDTESREKGDPSTSNRASGAGAETVALLGLRSKSTVGDDEGVELM